jgi:glucose-1-phosphate adenylyltransferase
MGIYVFSKGVLKRMLEENRGMDFGKEIIPDELIRIGSLAINLRVIGQTSVP